MAKQGKFSQPRNAYRGAEESPVRQPVREVPQTPAESPIDATMIFPVENPTDATMVIPVDMPPEVPVSTPEGGPIQFPVEDAFSPEDPLTVDDLMNASGADMEEDPDPENPAIAKNKKIVLISLCVVTLVLLLGAVAALGYLLSGGGDDGLILNNVTVAGINLGGMTQEEAAKALHKATDLTFTGTDMVILLPEGETLVLTPANTGASLDVDAAVQAAYDYGRTGGKAEIAAAKAQVLTGQYHIALLPYLNLNTDYIRDQLEEYGESFNSTYSEASYTMEGEMPALDAENYDESAPCQTLMLTVGAPGQYIDIDALYDRVLDAYSFNTFEVDASKVEVQDPEELDLDAIFEEYYVEPVNAAMDMETFEVTPETYGYTFDLERAKELLAEAEPGATIGIPMEYVIPEVLGEGLEDVLFRDVLGYCETKHTNNEARNNNLRLACEAINDYILMPGEEFSYNDVLGKRTTEAGYKAAAAYSGGQTVYEIGGGICQVSSTLYYCTLLADLEITDRSAHSFVSSYIDYGMDATVSWGGPEFKFANNTNYPIRIEAEVSDGMVKIQLIGTDEKDYYVEMEYEILSIKNYEVVYEEYAQDNAEGYKDGQVIQTPYTGYTVKTYKCKYDKETKELISRDYEDTSKYAARDQIIAKIVSDPSTTQPSESETTAPTEAPTTAPTETTTPTEPSTEAPTTEATDPTTAPTEAPTTAPTEAPADNTSEDTP